jgi:hypothetical protein
MIALGWGAVFERGEPRISRMGRMGWCASRDDGEGVGLWDVFCCRKLRGALTGWVPGG